MTPRPPSSGGPPDSRGPGKVSWRRAAFPASPYCAWHLSADPVLLRLEHDKFHEKPYTSLGSSQNFTFSPPFLRVSEVAPWGSPAACPPQAEWRRSPLPGLQHPRREPRGAGAPHPPRAEETGGRRTPQIATGRNRQEGGAGPTWG